MVNNGLNYLKVNAAQSAAERIHRPSGAEPTDEDGSGAATYSGIVIAIRAPSPDMRTDFIEPGPTPW